MNPLIETEKIFLDETNIKVSSKEIEDAIGELQEA